MKTGLSIPPFTDAATLVELAVDAEASGWDGLFLWDHLVFDLEQRPDVHDPWVLLGAIAARTQRLTLGTMVTPLARRRPWVVAKHLTTLDHLSGGRAVLGVGLGTPADAEFGDFGEPSEARDRAAILDESLALVDALLRGPVNTGPAQAGQGRFQVDTELRPRPVQQPRPPIWVAAIAPRRRPLERAAHWDGVVPLGPNGFMTPAEVATYVESVDHPVNWEVIAPRAPGVPGGEYADVGVTWLIDSTWPAGDWVSEFRDRIRSGPQA